jgi:hypothetical protein
VSTSGLDPERRAALLSMKLRALVRDGFGVEDANPVPFGGGAGLVGADRAWVLVEDDPHRALGPALAWARSQQIDPAALTVLVEEAHGLLARRAAAFASAPQIFWVEGRAVGPADPVAHAPLPEAPAGTDAAAELLRAADVEVVVEHGDLVGEVLGLEIARVVVDPEHGPRLEVGVGRHDREAFAMLHGDLPPEDALAKVVASVRQQRRADAAPHPLNRLAGERWLRARLVAEPALVGAVALAPVATARPRDSVKDLAPAPALGSDGDGQAVVVVASVGIDLDLVPTAADIRLRDAAADTRLVLAVPERDAHAVTQALAAQLAHPAEVVALAGDWRRGA